MKRTNFSDSNIIFFRADANSKLGFGHLMRCIYLAVFLKDRGVSVYFISQSLPEFIIDKLKLLEIPIYILPDKDLYTQENSKADVKNIVDKIGLMKIKPDWLVIDHYSIDSFWENTYKNYYPETKILVLDDLANREHLCDVLVDSGINSNSDRYQNKVPVSCKHFHGTDYVFLDYQLLKFKPQEPKRDFTQKKIHIFMGSQDTSQLTTKYTLIFLKYFEDVNLNIVVGPNYTDQKELNELTIKNAKKTTLTIAPITMVDSLLGCNIAFGAPGVTTWERAFLGIPSIYVSTHPNQEKILEAMANKGFCTYLGSAQKLSEKKIIDGLNQFISKQLYLHQLSLNSLKAVDGLGTSRIGEYLCSKI
ncbi:MAG: UDP-2,4-diacetamido-2,4,6-trideoxy-beta-L-altropyranose hydrolase [Methylococcales bacterium]|nr:UDP-2,4-diacetamido-2,4,6-trideoxy-beta-L-altropyranose hydrolase [Methylococcales bacterium]